MKHSHVLHMLNDYVDGLLGEEKKAAVDEHLAICENCRAELEKLRFVREKIGRLNRVSAPPGFLQSIHRRLETKRKPRFSFGSLFPRLRIAVPAGAAALATAVIALVFVLNVMEPRRGLRETALKDAHESYVEKEIAPMEAPELEADAGPSVEEEELMEQPLRSDVEPTVVQEKALHEEKRKAVTAKKAAPEAEDDATEPVEISLLLYGEKHDRSEGESHIEEARAAGMESRSTEIAALDKEAEEYMTEEPLIEEMLVEDESESPEIAESVLFSIERLVLSAGGRVLSIEYGEKHEIPQSMLVEIPIHGVDAFVDNLNQLGETIIPEGMGAGAYRSKVPDEVEAWVIKINLEPGALKVP